MVQICSFFLGDTEETKGVFFLLKHSVDAAQRDYQKDFGE